VKLRQRPYSRDKRKISIATHCLTPFVRGFFVLKFNMFTGIIKNQGKIIKKNNNTVEISTNIKLIEKLSIGESIAINGICLTAVDKTDNSFSIDFIPETKKRTNLQYLKINDIVNLELPTTPTTLLSGHIVQGHIDTTAKIVSINKKDNSTIFRFEINSKWIKYIVEKGSIAINGISLTVISSVGRGFTVGIIPHTFNNTNLSELRVNDFVNIEVDILAKYLEKLINKN
jgi:riboflavin synthase